MSESDATPEAIDDEQLPEDLRPDDNPLAQGLEPGETVDDLLTGGKRADEPETAESDTQDTQDTQDGADGAS